MGRERLPALALAVLVLAAVPALRAAELSGRVELVSSAGRRARGVDVGDVVVAFLPDQRTPPRPPKQPFEMATVRKAFEPEILVVPVGATVVFPNFDPILHNVFSITPGSAFDVGVYGRGEGKSATFAKAGLVRVFCNVHQDMFGHILVVDTPFYQVAEADGSFRFEGLPAGPGRLLLWHPQGEITVQLAVAPRRGLAVELETSRRRVPPHLNKFGKPYRSRRDRYNG